MGDLAIILANDLKAISEAIVDLQERVGELERETIRIKVSENGKVTVLGVHPRYPISLTKDHWLEIIKRKEEILKFIEDNETEIRRRRTEDKVRGFQL